MGVLTVAVKRVFKRHLAQHSMNCPGSLLAEFYTLPWFKHVPWVWLETLEYRLKLLTGAWESWHCLGHWRIGQVGVTQ